MYKIYHLPFCSSSRTARLILGEKNIKFESIIELPWKRRNDFLKLNPANTVPVTIDENKNIIIGSDVLAEYLDENKVGQNIMGCTSDIKLEVRRIYRWFDKVFDFDVTKNIVYEKIFKNLEGLGEPSSSHIRAGRLNLINHLDYFEWLLERRSWLAGENLSLADITGSAYISSVDYLGEIPWSKYKLVKEWYSKIKSRPSFRPLLKETMAGISPSTHYSNLDF